MSTRLKHNLIITLPDYIGSGTLSALQETALDSIQRSQTSAVIFDCSATKLIDAIEFEELRKIAFMAEVLGAFSIFAGLRPSTIKFLIDADVDVTGVRAFAGIDAALDYLETGAPPRAPQF